MTVLLSLFFLTNFSSTRRLPRSTITKAIEEPILVQISTIQVNIFAIYDCLNVLTFEWIWFISSLCYPSKILSESPSSRCFPHNASSRINVELNILEVTTILLTDDLFRHSLHCNIVFCKLWIIPSLSVNFMSILGATMMPEPHE